MRIQMQSATLLKSAGLDYSELLAVEAQDEAHICFLLEVLGVHCHGPYACLCICAEVTGVTVCCNLLASRFSG